MKNKKLKQGGWNGGECQFAATGVMANDEAAGRVAFDNYWSLVPKKGRPAWAHMPTWRRVHWMKVARAVVRNEIRKKPELRNPKKPGTRG